MSCPAHRNENDHKTHISEQPQTCDIDQSQEDQEVQLNIHLNESNEPQNELIVNETKSENDDKACYYQAAKSQTKDENVQMQNVKNFYGNNYDGNDDVVGDNCDETSEITFGDVMFESILCEHTIKTGTIEPSLNRIIELQDQEKENEIKNLQHLHHRESSRPSKEQEFGPTLVEGVANLPNDNVELGIGFLKQYKLSNLSATFKCK